MRYPKIGMLGRGRSSTLGMCLALGCTTALVALPTDSLRAATPHIGIAGGGMRAIVPVQSETASPATGEAAAASEEPVSANDLKAAINAIKQRLAEQQKGRRTSSTSELAAELKAAQASIADLTDSLGRLRGERDGLIAEIRALTAEVSDRDARIAVLEQEAAQSARETSASLTSLEQERSTLQNERDELRENVADMERRLGDTLGEVDALTRTVTEAWSDRDRIEQALQEARAQASNELQDRDSELSGAREQLATAEAELAETAAARDTLTAELATVRKTAADAEAERDRLAGGLAEATARIATLETDLAARDTTLVEAEQERARLVEEARRIEREADGRLRERTEALTIALDDANGLIESLETEITGLREVATTSVGEVETLGGQLITALEENEVMLAALADLRENQALLDTELQAARSDVQLYSAEAQSLRSQLASFQEDGGAAGNAGSVETADGGTEFEAMAAKLATAQAEVDRLTEELILREERLLALSNSAEGGEDSETLAALDERDAEIAPASGPTQLEALVDAGVDEPLDQTSAESDPPAAEVVVASIEPIVEIDAFLEELNAIDIGDGWLMTVPDGIVFELGSDELAVEASPALGKIASLVNYFGNPELRIVGHTDSFGDAAVNRSLSLRRADSVRDFLISGYGLDAASITTDGFGEDQPIASNDTISGRRANRRVEIFVRRPPS